MILLATLLQAAAAAPDIELNINARARSVTIERKGEAKLEVSGGEGGKVDVRVEPEAAGRTTLRNVTVEVRAQASVGTSPQIGVRAETTTPQ
jgi:hypothetical protein